MKTTRQKETEFKEIRSEIKRLQDQIDAREQLIIDIENRRLQELLINECYNKNTFSEIYEGSVEFEITLGNGKEEFILNVIVHATELSHSCEDEPSQQTETIIVDIEFCHVYSWYLEEEFDITDDTLRVIKNLKNII